MTVQNTFGNAWIDSFGPGIATINISGTSGWGSGDLDIDWLEQFTQLREVAFTKWHEITQGETDLTPFAFFFIDALDNRTAKCVPQNFTMKRSKSRPLLIQYNIQLLVIEDASAPGDVSAPDQDPGDSPELSGQMPPIETFNGDTEDLQTQIGFIDGAVETIQSVIASGEGALSDLLASVDSLNEALSLVASLASMAESAMSEANNLMAFTEGLANNALSSATSFGASFGGALSGSSGIISSAISSTQRMNTLMNTGS